MEIGSIFEIDPALVSRCEEESRRRFLQAGLQEVNKYKKRHNVYTASGREAIALALESIESRRPDLPKRCLLPAYMCEVVFPPFLRAGWEVSFYFVGKDLTADRDRLQEQISRMGAGLLFIHPYFGIDTWAALRPQLREWRRQGICIMEDVTQSYYLEEISEEADYIIGSLRKWYPVPDGGFAASDEPFPEIMQAEAGETRTEDMLAKAGELQAEVEKTQAEAARQEIRERLQALTAKWRYLHEPQDAAGKREQKAEFLKRNRELEERLDEYAGIRPLSRETACLLCGIDEADAKRRRSENYRYLYEKLQGMTTLAPILKPDEEDGQKERAVAPLYFAIYAKDRDALQKYLVRQDIYAPVLWPVGQENADCLTAEENYIYSHMLALPLDQRYGRAEMERMVWALEEYDAGNAPVDIRADEDNMLAGIRADADNMLVGIRVDANSTVATGHVMRCITIARELKRKGSLVLFFTADAYAGPFLEEAGMEYVCLDSDWRDMVKELPRLREELTKRGCRKLLVDSYQAHAEYFEGLKDLCKLIYIDDCFEQRYPVDLLINYNAYHVRFPYAETYRGETKLLLGTAYVPLREEFRARGGRTAVGQVPEETSADRGTFGAESEDREMPEFPCGLRQVLISSGGGDAFNAMGGILGEAVQRKKLEGVVFHTIAGRFNPHREELEALAAQHENIRLWYEVEHMAALMGQCDAAVSAAGTMLFELSAMQLPTVFFVSADNQQYDSEFFTREGRMLFAGDIRKEREDCIRTICDSLELLGGEDAMREKMRRALGEVTDARGAERIACAILEKGNQYECDCNYHSEGRQ